MERITKAEGNKQYTAVDVGTAVKKLGRFEDLCIALLKEQEHTIFKIERLKGEDKTKTVQFRQLLAKKMTNQNIIDLMGIYDLL